MSTFFFSLGAIQACLRNSDGPWELLCSRLLMLPPHSERFLLRQWAALGRRCDSVVGAACIYRLGQHKSFVDVLPMIYPVIVTLRVEHLCGHAFESPGMSGLVASVSLTCWACRWGRSMHRVSWCTSTCASRRSSCSPGWLHWARV